MSSMLTNVYVSKIMCTTSGLTYTYFIWQINACNGRHCGDTFTGPNKPYKPAIWTENWTAQ